eukprot:14960849-Heterocapsa_arctica.AAC.1
MVLYCPPSTTGAAARLLFDKVLRWASQVLSKLLKRTVHVVMMDSNAHIGTPHYLDSTAAVGPWTP